jgi:type VII secretion protein EccB
MAQTPTSKAQVQAYRFVLKRMESALVRRDAVMLHDPMRTHLRAAIVGLIVALVVVAGFLVYGLFKPKSTLAEGIVVGKQSGATYVFVTNPERRLIPVTNLASARLILLAQQQNGGSQPGPGSGAVEPRLVDDSALRDITRTPVAGIPGAPNDIPTSQELVDPKWSVCDTVTVNERDPDPTAKPEVKTTALIGLDRPGRPLGGQEGLLLRYDANAGSSYYLVHSGKRHRIDPTNAAVRNAFDLQDPRAQNTDDRLVSVGFLNAIPPGEELKAPAIPGSGTQSRFEGLTDLQVGDVFKVESAQQGGTFTYWVILQNGVQRVPHTLADLLLNTAGRFDEIPPRRATVVTPLPNLNVLDTDGFPEDAPPIVPIRQSTVACLHWVFAEDRQQFTVTVSDRMFAPGGLQATQLAQRDGRGDRLDEVMIQGGKGAAVRSVVENQTIGTGTMFLVTDQGVKFGIPTAEIAGALGLQEFKPAPESIVSLLHAGPALDPNDAICTFDSVPAEGSCTRLPQEERNGR